MRFSAERVRELAAARGISLSALLREAGVSRNAFYSLARRESTFPKSVHRIADALGVAAAEMFEPAAGPSNDVLRLVAEARRITTELPDIDFENVWHTLLVLRETPVQRLRRSLRRGRAAPLW